MALLEKSLKLKCLQEAELIGVMVETGMKGASHRCATLLPTSILTSDFAAAYVKISPV